MRHKTLAAVFFFVGLGSIAFGIFGQTWSTIFLAMGAVLFLLAYAANRWALPVNVLTGVKTEKGDVWDDIK
ncbi:MAG: hypothetical protein ABI690_30800 [Chloroflexota bacterium]